MNQISIGVLAGGKSTRMGQNKALLEVNQQSFISKICTELGGFDELLISVAEKGMYADLGYPTVCDEHADIGPIEGIYQLVAHAHNEYVFVCAVDMPFMQKELVSYMAEYISSDYDCYCMMDEDHIHPLCAIYSKKMLPVIAAQIAKGQYRLMDVLRQVQTKYIHLETSCFDSKVVKNINTKEEYTRLSLPVIFCVSGVKDSGKTGLIIKLINEFIRENYSVAVIRHDGHDYIMDYEGTDTARYTQAGARCSAIFSDTHYSINGSTHTTIEELLTRCYGSDIIILEGLKHSPYPKIEVVRSVISRRPVCDTTTLICLATDLTPPPEISCPTYDLNNISGIYLCIKKFFGL